MSTMTLSDAAHSTSATPKDDVSLRLVLLQRAIEHASHMLPAQGPINVFIHHNTLHAFEHLPFDEAVVAGGKVFHCQPYLSEEKFREKHSQGRIRNVDLREILSRDLGDKKDECVASLSKRIDMRLAMLHYPLRVAPLPELRWFIAETDALRAFRRDLPAEQRTAYLARARAALGPALTAASAGRASGSHHFDLFTRLLRDLPPSPDRWSDATWENCTLISLWRVCRQGVHGLKKKPDAAAWYGRPRDLLMEAAGTDSDLLVHEVLIRFCAAFLDQGLSQWLLPRRAEGFFRAFVRLYEQPGGPPDSWLVGLPAELKRIEQAGLGPLESILESLDLLGIEQPGWAFLTSTLLALRGWGGMIHQIEVRGDRVPCPIPQHSLVEFLAVRLVLDRLALAHVARESLGFDGPLSELQEAAHQRLHREPADHIEQRAFLVFQLAQALGWLPTELQQLSKPKWQELIHEIEAFSPIERRRVFHAAFERRYRVQTLDAIAAHATQPHEPPVQPKFQLVCCLDEREESFRRHLEEIEPAVETFGAAGFYNVAMYYRGAADAHFVPLCPIIIQPRHWVVEDVAYTHDELHGRRAQARRMLGKTSHQLHVGTRTITGGAIITAGLGALAAIPLVARVLFPRLTAQIRRLAGRLVQPPSATKLRLERSCAEAGPENGSIGFLLEEMVNTGERLLRDIGLTKGFARLVVLLGHGSFSLNNPHNSAYNCGACGGSAGGPNARAFAHMMNDPRVRLALRGRGIDVPDESRFIGGYHNTCNDEVEYFDLDQLPATHKEEFDHVRNVVVQTCARNAHERCRRFMSAPLVMSFAAAKRHVESRSEDLAQTRPELGHATNALCIVARRNRTRGKYLDRRAFLTTYDPTQDDAQGTILLRLMQAAVPVCAGINLEYYFSHVDPTGFGCGTKLPHNVTSLLGVMDGAASDLRTGLPWQMVEIHEPVRLLFIVETTPEVMLGLMERNADIGRLCRNGWVQVATLDPHSNAVQLLHRDHFEPYQPEQHELTKVPTSLSWYQGKRDHLGYAQIEPQPLTQEAN
jgi:uncharacterized protein YbcC (UPF0753/DUF2309 family)